MGTCTKGDREPEAVQGSLLNLGATMEGVMEVLKVCVAEGVLACNLRVPILAEELANRSAKDARP